MHCRDKNAAARPVSSRVVQSLRARAALAREAAEQEIRESIERMFVAQDSQRQSLVTDESAQRNSFHVRVNRGYLRWIDTGLLPWEEAGPVVEDPVEVARREAKELERVELFSHVESSSRIELADDEKESRNVLLLVNDEISGRLELSMLQTSHRNVHYVAMTKAYLRWVETGLNPGEPDPFVEDPEIVAQRIHYFETAFASIHSEEFLTRHKYERDSAATLGSLYEMLYVLIEEMSIRYQITHVVEPQRWDKVLATISDCLSHVLSEGPALFRKWSLIAGGIERDEVWSRSLLEALFAKAVTLQPQS